MATGRPDRHLHDERDRRRRAASGRGRGPPRPGARSSSARPTGRPSSITSGHRRPSTRSASSRRRPAGPALPACPAEASQPTWRPLAARAFAEATQRATRPGPGPPQSGLPGAADRARRAAPPPGRARSQPLEPYGPAGTRRRRRWPGAASSSPAARCHPATPRSLLDWPSASDGRCWPIPARAAGSRGRSPPPTPSCAPSRRCPRPSCMLGTPWLSKALAEYVAAARGRGARVIVVDPWWQWTDPTRVATEFHHVDPDAWLTAPRSTERQPVRPEWLASAGRPWRSRHRRPSTRPSGPSSASRRWPGCCHRHAAAAGATIVVSASMPMRDLEWFAPALAGAAAGPGQPWRQRHRRRRLDGARHRRQPDGRTIALLGDLAFLHDVSGLVNLPDVAVHIRRRRQRGRGDLLVPAAGDGASHPSAFETALRHAADQSTSARSPRGSAFRSTK